MRNLIVATSLLFALSPRMAVAEGKWFFETQSVTPAVHDRLIIDAGGEANLSEQFGWRFFTLMNAGFAQAYVGPVWQPAPWVKVSACVGGRQDKGVVDLQTAYLLGLQYDRFSFLGQTEVGRLAFAGLPAQAGDKKQIWYDLTARVQIWPWLTLGVKDRRPVGAGPLIEFKWWKVTLWSAYAPIAAEKVEWDVWRFMVGVKIGN